MYRDQLPAFLHYAEQCYAEVCSDNYSIKQNEVALAAIDGFEDAFYAEVIDDVHTVFYLDEATEVSDQEFTEAMVYENQKYKNPDKLKLAKDYLKKKQGVEQRTTNATKKGEPSKRWFVGIGLAGLKGKTTKTTPTVTPEAVVNTDNTPVDTEVTW